MSTRTVTPNVISSRRIAPPSLQIILAAAFSSLSAYISLAALTFLIPLLPLLPEIIKNLSPISSLMLFLITFYTLAWLVIFPFFAFFLIFGKYELRSSASLAHAIALVFGITLMFFSPNPYLQYAPYLATLLPPLTIAGKIKLRWSVFLFFVFSLLALVPRDTTQYALTDFFSKIIGYWV